MISTESLGHPYVVFNFKEKVLLECFKYVNVKIYAVRRIICFWYRFRNRINNGDFQIRFVFFFNSSVKGNLIRIRDSDSAVV